MNETEKLIQKTHSLDFDSLPDEVVDRTKYLILDYLGVAARGALSESSQPIHNLILNSGMAGYGAVVIGTNIKTMPVYAAIANGVAAHSLELDDVVNEASLHPAVTIISAALSASHIARCSGKNFIEAVVSGYEVAIRLGIALNPSAHYARGFHPTGTCGTMGSAITAAKILNLDKNAMMNSLGIAGSQASGLMEFLSDGAFTKRLHAGWAAHCGIMAALLSKEGFTGPGTIIEGKFGFLNAYSGNSNPSVVLANWGSPYNVMKTSIKPHSCCRYIQGSIDGILMIMSKHRLKSSDIEKVTLGLLKTGIPIIAKPEELKCNPKTIVDAQFSMPFGAAVAILYGRASLEEYTLENINSPVVREIMGKIYFFSDPELEKEFPKKWPTTVSIVTKSGEEFFEKIEYPRGDPEKMLTWEELIDKFKTLASPVFSDEKINIIIEKIRSLENEVNICALSELFLK